MRSRRMQYLQWWQNAIAKTNMTPVDTPSQTCFKSILSGTRSSILSGKLLLFWNYALREKTNHEKKTFNDIFPVEVVDLMWTKMIFSKTTKKSLQPQDICRWYRNFLRWAEKSGRPKNFPRGGGVPYIGHTGMCGLYRWVFSRRKVCRYGYILGSVPMGLTEFIKNRLKTANYHRESHDF